MMDGEERKGKVTAIGDQDITFFFEGETLEYKIQRSEINRIVFGSGRTQVITEKAVQSGTASRSSGISDPAERKGKMAVVPFKIITNMDSVDKEALGRQVQADCVNTIREDAPMIEVLDPRIVNATLAKENITIDQLQVMLPEEVAVLLGAEHVVFGSFEVENTGTRTTGSSVTSYKSKDDRSKSKGTAVSSGSSSTSDTYDSKITMDIYNDRGSSIYSASRKPFSADLDEYHSTIKYLIKRAPFGSKR
jgi:activator of HSP90 ATPase